MATVAKLCPAGHSLVSTEVPSPWTCPLCDSELDARSLSYCCEECEPKTNACEDCASRPCPGGHICRVVYCETRWECLLPGCGKKRSRGQNRSCAPCNFTACVSCAGRVSPKTSWLEFWRGSGSRDEGLAPCVRPDDWELVKLPVKHLTTIHDDLLLLLSTALEPSTKPSKAREHYPYMYIRAPPRQGKTLVLDMLCRQGQWWPSAPDRFYPVLISLEGVDTPVQEEDTMSCEAALKALWTRVAFELSGLTSFDECKRHALCSWEDVVTAFPHLGDRRVLLCVDEFSKLTGRSETWPFPRELLASDLKPNIPEDNTFVVKSGLDPEIAVCFCYRDGDGWKPPVVTEKGEVTGLVEGSVVTTVDAAMRQHTKYLDYIREVKQFFVKSKCTVKDLPAHFSVLRRLENGTSVPIAESENLDKNDVLQLHMPIARRLFYGRLNAFMADGNQIVLTGFDHTPSEGVEGSGRPCHTYEILPARSTKRLMKRIMWAYACSGRSFPCHVYHVLQTSPGLMGVWADACMSETARKGPSFPTTVSELSRFCGNWTNEIRLKIADRKQLIEKSFVETLIDADIHKGLDLGVFLPDDESEAGVRLLPFAVHIMVQDGGRASGMKFNDFTRGGETKVSDFLFNIVNVIEHLHFPGEALTPLQVFDALRTEAIPMKWCPIRDEAHGAQVADELKRQPQPSPPVKEGQCFEEFVAIALRFRLFCISKKKASKGSGITISDLVAPKTWFSLKIPNTDLSMPYCVLNERHGLDQLLHSMLYDLFPSRVPSSEVRRYNLKSKIDALSDAPRDTFATRFDEICLVPSGLERGHKAAALERDVDAYLASIALPSAETVEQLFNRWRDLAATSDAQIKTFDSQRKKFADVYRSMGNAAKQSQWLANDAVKKFVPPCLVQPRGSCIKLPDSEVMGDQSTVANTSLASAGAPAGARRLQACFPEPKQDKNGSEGYDEFLSVCAGEANAFVIVPGTGDKHPDNPGCDVILVGKEFGTPKRVVLLIELKDRRDTSAEDWSDKLKVVQKAMGKIFAQEWSTKFQFIYVLAGRCESDFSVA